MNSEIDIRLALDNLKRYADQVNAGVEHKGDGHFQIRAALLVNYYPLSKRRTAYVAGQSRGLYFCTPRDAVELAAQVKIVEAPAKPRQRVEAKPGKGFARLSGMFKRQGGLCSLCGGPMVLVDFVALKAAERRKAYANPLVATRDHTIPKSVAKAIDYNCRAAHKGCNEMKSAELIEPYPLGCYDAARMPRIKLPGGELIEMVPE